jgi:hypothetical protein
VCDVQAGVRQNGHLRQADQLQTAPVIWSSGTKMCAAAPIRQPRQQAFPNRFADVKADPSHIPIASAGAGSIGHLVGEFFRGR